MMTNETMMATVTNMTDMATNMTDTETNTETNTTAMATATATATATNMTPKKYVYFDFSKDSRMVIPFRKIMVNLINNNDKTSLINLIKVLPDYILYQALPHNVEIDGGVTHLIIEFFVNNITYYNIKNIQILFSWNFELGMLERETMEKLIMIVYKLIEMQDYDSVEFYTKHLKMSLICTLKRNRDIKLHSEYDFPFTETSLFDVLIPYNDLYNKPFILEFILNKCYTTDKLIKHNHRFFLYLVYLSNLNLNHTYKEVGDILRRIIEKVPNYFVRDDNTMRYVYKRSFIKSHCCEICSITEVEYENKDNDNACVICKYNIIKYYDYRYTKGINKDHSFNTKNAFDDDYNLDFLTYLHDKFKSFIPSKLSPASLYFLNYSNHIVSQVDLYTKDGEYNNLQSKYHLKKVHSPFDEKYHDRDYKERLSNDYKYRNKLLNVNCYIDKIYAYRQHSMNFRGYNFLKREFQFNNMFCDLCKEFCMDFDSKNFLEYMILLYRNDDVHNLISNNFNMFLAYVNVLIKYDDFKLTDECFDVLLANIDALAIGLTKSFFNINNYYLKFPRDYTNYAEVEFYLERDYIKINRFFENNNSDDSDDNDELSNLIKKYAKNSYIFKKFINFDLEDLKIGKILQKIFGKNLKTTIMGEDVYFFDYLDMYSYTNIESISDHLMNRNQLVAESLPQYINVMLILFKVVTNEKDATLFNHLRFTLKPVEYEKIKFMNVANLNYRFNTIDNDTKYFHELKNDEYYCKIFNYSFKEEFKRGILRIFKTKLQNHNGNLILDKLETHMKTNKFDPIQNYLC